MKFKLINGNEININISKSRHPILDYDHKKSELQYNVGQDLLIRFPNYDIIEELYIIKENFSLDFFIPKLKIAFEAHGEQHYKFIPHFHQFKHHFIYAQTKDRQKLDWCNLNDITLTIIPYTENTEEKIKKFLDKSLK